MRHDAIPPLEDVVLAHAGYVRGVARAVLGGDDAVEDVVQDTWLVAARAGPRRAGALRAWLAVVARNLSYRVLRGTARRTARERRAARGERGPDVAEIAETEEMRRRLVGALLTLEEPYRGALLLRYYESLSVPEVALRLGVPLETARTRLRRGLARLRERLDEGHREGRRAWVVALAPLAQGPRPAPGLVLLQGVVMKKAIAIVVALLLIGSLGWVVLGPWGSGAAVTRRDEEASVQPPPLARDAGLAARGKEDGSVRTVRGEPHVTGRVVDADGSPVPRARVRAWRDDLASVVEPEEATGGPVTAAETDAQGAFTVPLEGSAPAFTLHATAAGFAPAALSGLQAHDHVTIVLGRGATLHGTVRDLEERPIAGARVRWTGFVGNARTTAETVSASDGTYRLEGLSASAPASTSDFMSLLAESLDVRAEGFAPIRVPRTRARSRPDRGTTFPTEAWDVWLGRGATFRGRVLDAETKEPVAQARVVLWAEQELGGISAPDGSTMQNPAYFAPVGDTTTAPDGTFTIVRVPAWGVHLQGIHVASAFVRRLGRLGVVAPGHAIATQEVSVPTEGEVVEVEVRVTTAGAIRGRVLEPGGKPAVGAFVGWKHLAAWPWTWIPPVFPGLDLPSGKTDAEGRYLLPLVEAARTGAKPIQVRASPASASPWGSLASVEVTPRSGETVEAPDLVLGSGDPAGASALVTVVDEKGGPVWGATFGGCGPGARTDESGRARLFFDAGIQFPTEVTVTVRAPGRSEVSSPPIPLAVGTVPEVRVVLGPRRPPTSSPLAVAPTEAPAAPAGFALEGTIRDARTGSPLLKWELTLRSEGDDRARAFPVGPGRFRFEGVSAGTWSLEARAEGYEPEVRPGLRVGPDGTSDALDVRLAAGIVVRGRVRDEAGVPLGGARVLFNGQGVPSLHGDASPEGRFSVRGFRADARYAVWVARDDGRGTMSYWVPRALEDLHVAADATVEDRELTVAVAGAVQVSVASDALGTAAEPPTAAQRAAGTATAFTFTSADGTTAWRTTGVWQGQRSALLPVGPWTVKVEVPGAPAREVAFLVKEGEPVPVALTIP